MARLLSVVARRWREACVGIVLVLLAVDTARALHGFGFRFTDDDISLFWYGAKEFAHGHFREPFLYGQSYDTLIECLPGAGLLALGLSPWVSLALVSTAFGLIPWLLLALLAWRKGAQNLAILIAAGPLLLPVSYTFLLDKFFASGVLAVVVGIFLVETPGRAWRSFAFGLLLSLGCIVLYENAVIVGVPALAYVAMTRWGQWRAYALIAAGIACGVAVDVAGQVWYRVNPGWVVHPAPANTWSLHNVGSGLRHIDDFMGWFAPWFAPWGGLALVALAGIAAVMLWRRNVAAAAVAGAALLTSIGVLAFDKAHDGQTNVFFPLQRVYLALPIAIVLAVVVGVRGARRLDPRWALAVVLLAGVGFGYRQVNLDDAIAASGWDAPGITTPRTVSSLEAECATILQVAQTNGAELVVNVLDRGLAYGCGAIDYGKVSTLFPSYERRTWRLEEEQRARRTVVLFSEASPALCETAAAHGFTCSLVPGTPMVAVVRTPPMSPLDVITALGIPIRSFS